MVSIGKREAGDRRCWRHMMTTSRCPFDPLIRWRWAAREIPAQSLSLRAVLDCREKPRDKERHSVLPSSLLAAHFLHWPVIRARALLQRRSTCGLRLRQGPASSPFILLCDPEDRKTLKTAWEYYNEGMYAATPRHVISILTTTGMENHRPRTLERMA